jgi:23S rRNA (adenine2503-C2)-methyltransferase
MNPLGLTVAELSGELARQFGKGRFHAEALYRSVFREGCLDPAAMPEFARSPSRASRVAEALALPGCRVAGRREEDDVVKFIGELADGRRVESVLIPARGRNTLCVSTQAGCRWACAFCATGGMGFHRDLRADEIVWQVWAARFLLGRPVDKVVFMGMGEPLDNPESVFQAVRILGEPQGFNLDPARITLSTTGHADGLRRLAASDVRKVRLAISLNAAEDGLRDRLMPINRVYPLARLRQELDAYPLSSKAVFLIEYVLLAGVNDAPGQAVKLAAFLEGLPVRINLIAYNPGPDHIATRAGNGLDRVESRPNARRVLASDRLPSIPCDPAGPENVQTAPRFRTPSEDAIRAFRHTLEDAGFLVRVRPVRGRAIHAACGQLAALPP